ncbi:hypothetical protein [Streptomyces sp. Pv4-95]|uniref:hypothetical protein n=1 Tax=Streptomyces sp. Pv4-95 TaxID=3049543 RepID=UPI003892552F
MTNSDGQGRRQQFEGGTVYWHPTLLNGSFKASPRTGPSCGGARAWAVTTTVCARGSARVTRHSPTPSG